MRTRTKFILFIGAVLALLALPIRSTAQNDGTGYFSQVPATNGLAGISTNYVLPYAGTNATTSMVRVYNASQVGFFVGGASQAGSAKFITNSITVYRSQDGVNIESTPWIALTNAGSLASQVLAGGTTSGLAGTNGVPFFVSTNATLGAFQYFCLVTFNLTADAATFASNNAAGYVIKPGY